MIHVKIFSLKILTADIPYLFIYLFISKMNRVINTPLYPHDSHDISSNK